MLLIIATAILASALPKTARISSWTELRSHIHNAPNGSALELVLPGPGFDCDYDHQIIVDGEYLNTLATLFLPWADCR